MKPARFILSCLDMLGLDMLDYYKIVPYIYQLPISAKYNF